MKPLNTSLIKLTLVIILGAFAGFQLKPSIYLALGGLFTGLLLFIFTFFLTRKKFSNSWLFGIVTYLCFFLVGVFSSVIHLPENQESHYVHHISSAGITNPDVLQVRVIETLKPDLFNDKFIAEVELVNGKTVHGKIMLVHPKDSLKSPFSPGRKLIVVNDIQEIPGPLNPFQFNYRRFMAMRGVLGQTRLSVQNFELLPSVEKGLKYYAAQWREEIIRSLRKTGIEQDQLSIIQALLLGQKQQISEEIYDNYAAAGAIHILAVSGLHVGIIMLLLGWLLAPLNSSKKGKIFKSLLVIVSLWGFALLSGLSPSVVRAVTMFSFISIGLELGRRSSTINSVFLSLLLLVLIRPQWIFDVGFQLSYSAVLAIVLIQPLLYRLLTPRKRIPRYFWGLLTTTLAAQIGVFPLSLFYFNQFPGLFFLSNLVILPFLGVILGLGILVIFLSLFSLLPSFLAETYNIIIKSLNYFVEWVAQQEDFLFRDVSFSSSEVFGFYFLIISLILLLYSPNYKKLVTTVVAVIILQLIYIKNASEEKDQFVIFHRTGKTIIGIEKGEKLQTFSKELNSADQNVLTNFMIGENIKSARSEDVKNVFPVNEKILFVLDSTGIYPRNVNIQYMLIINSPRINLARVLEEVRPDLVIADGSNYKFLLDHWRKTSMTKNVSFYATAEKGALVLE